MHFKAHFSLRSVFDFRHYKCLINQTNRIAGMKLQIFRKTLALKDSNYTKRQPTTPREGFGDCKSPLSEPRNYKFRGAELFDICNVELQINRICNPAFVNKLEL